MSSTHSILPDDIDDPEAFLEQQLRAPSTTPREERPSCPNCGSVAIARRGDKFMSQSHLDDAYLKCKTCKETFPYPTRGEADE